ncbi:MAG: O-antigen translocase [bacterium]
MPSSSYRSVLKSTSVIGGSSLINMVIGMVRTKFVAVLLGPSGVGLMTVYTAISGMVSTVSSMGIDTSGVRTIAEAHGDRDEDRIARTVTTLLRIVWLTGILGLLTMILGCAVLSRLSFGTTDHALPIAVLGITVLLGNVTIGQTCLLQGTRRISVMAKVGIIGALNGTVLSIPCFCLWGVRGIVPGLILTAVAMLATTWWFAHQVAIQPVVVSWHESKTGAIQLLHFGLPVMLSGLVTAVGGYFVRALLVRQVGLEGVGVWQAAFTLSGVLVNFVLGAMVADYYPRLVAVAGDNRRVSEEVNSQTEIAMLLAVPGLAATLIFAPLAITLFYSGKFDAAVEILRWSVYGLLGQILSWPMRLVLLAKGMGKTFFSLEALGNVFYVAAIWLCTRHWGLPGAGIAFLLFYLFNTIMINIVVRCISHTVWTRANMIHMAGFGALLVLVGLISALVLNPWHQYLLNLPVLGAVSLYCLRYLSRQSGITPQTLRARILKRLGRGEPHGD